MRAAVLGGGPGGLNFAISLKLRDASHDVLVIERNKPNDTFGWGVVLSDETLGNLHTNDPVSSKAIRDFFVYWDDIAVHYRGQGDAVRRPRLQRHRPQATSQYSAGPCPFSWRED